MGTATLAVLWPASMRYVRPALGAVAAWLGRRPAVLGTIHDIANGYVWSFGLAAAIQFASAGIVLIRRAS